MGVLQLHTVLVLPLEQFVFNTFEKAPWREKMKERSTAKRGQREVEGEKQSKAHEQVRRSIQAVSNISNCRWGE